jgi:Orsellinic acid/F9775 biosynthesis cluster protein D
MNSYVIYNTQHQVIICKEHECAVSSKSIIRHFRDEHDITVEQRQEIFNFASTKIIVEADQLEYSIDRVLPIPYLKVVTAYQCQYEGCSLILSTVGSIKKHVKIDHAWKAKDGICWSDTQAQTFYLGNGRRFTTLRSD